MSPVLNLNIFLSPGVDPVISTIAGEGSQSAGSHSRPVETVQSHGGLGQAGLDCWGREAGWGLTGLVARLQAARHPSLAGLDGHRGGGILLLVVEKVAPGTVGTVASNPVLLASLGLVLTVLTNISHLLELQ